MISSAHHEEDNNIVVEYEDADMEELLQVEAGSHELRYEEEDHSDGDLYGGMNHDLYNDIVEFKKNNTYPSTLNSRQDRSALSHWRARCNRYTIADDNETLLYHNQNSTVSDAPKVVVKKGEVRRVIERVHELIGHLGQKRTQMAVLKKLHWRSVRQDVKTFILHCDFCIRKKVEGKKILKAPVDISSDSFGFTVKALSGRHIPDGDRLEISLVGYNEDEVHAAAVTRMTSYTFKETASEIRGGRYARIKPEFITPGSSSSFRRQPYIRRSRFTPYSTSYILPYTPKGAKEEPEFIIYNPGRSDGTYQGDEFEIDENMLDEARQQDQINIDMANDQGGSDISDERRHIDELQAPKQENHLLLYTGQQEQKRATVPRVMLSRKRKVNSQPTAGLAGRFSVAAGEVARNDVAHSSTDFFSSLEAVQNRIGVDTLTPLLMMPTNDPEVANIHKEVLTLTKEWITGQLRIQAQQEKVLQQQLDSERIPIARYGEIDSQGGQMHLIEDGGEGVMEELNVMDDGIN